MSDLKSTHQTVVSLLRKSGKSPIEAERLWDSYYSRQFTHATPGTHVIQIGEYEVEFTRADDRDPLQLIAQAHAEAQEAERDAVIRGWFRLARAVSVIVIVISLIVWFL